MRRARRRRTPNATARADRIAPRPAPDSRALRLVVRAADDEEDAGLREVLRARKGRRSNGTDPLALSMRAASELLTWPRLVLLRQIRARRGQTLTELGESTNRTAAGVRRDLRLLEQLGVLAPGNPEAAEVPDVRHARIVLTIEL